MQETGSENLAPWFMATTEPPRCRRGDQQSVQLRDRLALRDREQCPWLIVLALATRLAHPALGVLQNRTGHSIEWSKASFLTTAARSLAVEPAAGQLRAAMTSISWQAGDHLTNTQILILGIGAGKSGRR